MNIDIRRNMGRKDRTIRAALATFLAAGYYAEVLEGWEHTYFILIASYLLLTSMLGYGFLYLPFRFNTKEKPPDLVI